MSTPPNLAALYPDVLAQGSLGAALLAIATEQELWFPVEASKSASPARAAVPSVFPHRGDLTISASQVERRWSVRGTESAQGMALIEGSTQDLVQVARAANAWHAGTALVDLRQVASFVELTGRFEVPDEDPVLLTESEWQHLRKEAAEVGWPQYLALIEAAHAEPKLRALYPLTSHWTLRFSTRIRPELSRDVLVCLDAPSEADSGYVVRSAYLSTALGVTTTAAEAVALAVTHLPPGLGTVTSGRAKA